MSIEGFLIAGPTASGKSHLALTLAEKYQAAIINADSMQIYKALPILTAMPDKKDFERAEHFLYNYANPCEARSVGDWLEDVKEILARLRGKPFIIVGGTGLYFHALLGGLANIPKVSPSVREKWRKALEISGSLPLYEVLKQCDAQMAAQLYPQDGQRIVRALEIFDMTQKSLSFWQKQKTENLLAKKQIKKILLLPEREILYQNIEKRFDKMVEKGALLEVKTFFEHYKNEQKIYNKWPIMKAIGLLELKDHLEGRLTLEQAILLAKIRSRQYAKRQMTWFKNRFDETWCVT